MGPVTLLDIALVRLGRSADDSEPINGDDFYRVGLPMLGGCEVCGATVAAYNACPSRSGYIRCAKDCIADLGFATVADAEAFFEASAPTEGEL